MYVDKLRQMDEIYKKIKTTHAHIKQFLLFHAHTALDTTYIILLGSPTMLLASA